MIPFDPEYQIPDHLHFVVKRPARWPAGRAWRLRLSLARSLDRLATRLGELADLVSGQPSGVLLFRPDPASIERHQHAYMVRLSDIMLRVGEGAE